MCTFIIKIYFFLSCTFFFLTCVEIVSFSLTIGTTAISNNSSKQFTAFKYCDLCNIKEMNFFFLYTGIKYLHQQDHFLLAGFVQPAEKIDQKDRHIMPSIDLDLLQLSPMNNEIHCFHLKFLDIYLSCS